MAENLVALLRESRERHAQRALYGERAGGGWRWVTYAQFEQGVARYAEQLRDQGVCAGDRVVITGGWSLLVAQQAHAVCRCNASFVPLSERREVAAWRFILRHAEPRLVLLSERRDRLLLEALQREQGAAWRIVQLRDSTTLSERPAAGQPDPEPEQAASLYYRRGGSGLFSADVWTHRELCRRDVLLQQTSHSLHRALSDTLLLRGLFEPASPESHGSL
jgi:long-subunit acyl-CoA synthetase (AMP-forming)